MHSRVKWSGLSGVVSSVFVDQGGGIDPLICTAKEHHVLGRCYFMRGALVFALTRTAAAPPQLAPFSLSLLYSLSHVMLPRSSHNMGFLLLRNNMDFPSPFSLGLQLQTA